MTRLREAARWIALHELWLLAVAFPLLLFPTRWTPLGLAIIALTWLCRWVGYGRLTVRTPMDAPMALLLLTALLGLYVSVDISRSLPFLWRLILGMAVFYGLANGVRDKAQLRQVAAILVLAGLGLALVGLVGTDWSTQRLLDPGFYGRLPRLVRDVEDARSFNPRVTGLALATLLPVPLALLLFGHGRGLRLLSGLVVLVMAIVLLLTQTLQGALGLGAALLFMGVYWSRWFLLGIPVGIGLLVWTVLAYGPQRIASALLSIDHVLGIGVVLRWDIWSRALAMIGDMPYTGIGLDTFPAIQANFYPGFLLGPETHAHNLPMLFLQRLGLVGLAAFLWLLVSFACVVVKAHRRTPGRDGRALIIGLSGGVLAYVVSGSVDALWSAKPAVVLWVLLGMAAAAFRLADNPVERQDSASRVRPVPKALAWGLLPALLALSLLLAPGVRELNLGAVQAHKGLMDSRSSGVPSEDLLQSAAMHLQSTLARNPAEPHAYSLLGSIYAWLGDYSSAIEAYDRKVALDGRDPMARYAPFEVWRRRIDGDTGHDRWDDALWVYRHWKNRYPDRAEAYVWSAIVWDQHKGEPERAIATLQSGLDNGAQPRGLLSHYLLHLKPGQETGGSSANTLPPSFTTVRALAHEPS